MWAQLITARLKPGTDAEVQQLLSHLRDAEQPGSGLVRSTTMRDQNDPARLSILVVFESEEKARAREQDERRGEHLGAARAIMGEIFDGPMEFTDLTVVDEFVP
jgi:quinol monooxygenase YgiN